MNMILTNKNLLTRAYIDGFDINNYQFDDHNLIRDCYEEIKLEYSWREF